MTRAEKLINAVGDNVMSRTSLANEVTIQRRTAASGSECWDRNKVMYIRRAKVSEFYSEVRAQNKGDAKLEETCTENERNVIQPRE